MFGLFKNKNDRSEAIVFSPLEGEVISIKDIPDDAFSQGLLGDGIGIKPSNGKIYSPADCEVQTVFPTGHAIGLNLNNGAELLIHIGLDTVSLNGNGFDIKVSQGQKLKKGEIIGEFNIDKIVAKKLSIISPIVITNSEEFKIEILTQKSFVENTDELYRVSGL